jgi:hypothetical protein
MKNQLFHVFENTPFGREIFLQSIFFCKMTGLHLKVLIPNHLQFLMYFSREVVTIDLPKSFFTGTGTAREHVKDLVQAAGADASFLEPKGYTASTLPDIPTDFSFMACLRSNSDISSKFPLGHIGAEVRSIIKNAEFPILIPTPIYKEWKRIIVFFGGSINKVKALRLGIRLQLLSGVPMMLFTYAENKPKTYYEEILEEHNILSGIKLGGVEWLFAEKGHFKEALYDVPPDGLIVAGAYGHGLIKEVLFGDLMEEMHALLPNNMIIVGPHYRED